MQSEDRAVAVQAQRDAAERLKWRKAEEVERRWKREQARQQAEEAARQEAGKLAAQAKEKRELERAQLRAGRTFPASVRGAGLCK